MLLRQRGDLCAHVVVRLVIARTASTEAVAPAKSRCQDTQRACRHVPNTHVVLSIKLDGFVVFSSWYLTATLGRHRENGVK